MPAHPAFCALAPGGAVDGVLGIGDEAAGRLARGFRPLGADCLENRLVQGQGVAGIEPLRHGELEQFGEHRFDRAAERHDQFVAGRIEDGKMEAHIGDVPADLVEGGDHVRQCRLDLGQLLGRAIGCRKRCRLRLDHEADLLNFAGEPLIAHGRAVPGQHVAIEQVP